MKTNILKLFVVLFFFAVTGKVIGQGVATTSGAFLEMGFSTVGNAMGETQSFINPDISALYYNPAAVGYLEQSEIQITYMPWIVGIESSFITGGFAHPLYGTFALSLIQTSFGEEEVTTVSRPNGTGEVYDGTDLAVALTYGRRLTNWFAFGATFKYVNSRIWHESASAVAVDLGAIVNTSFFAWSDQPGDGLNIGMSITNYGTRMKYDGQDIREIIDIEPDKNGNYGFIPVRYETNEWELPLTARIGVSVNPLIIDQHRITVGADFLHSTSSNEYMNLGAQYSLNSPAFGQLHIRGGYKGLNLEDSDFGLTLGFGVVINKLGNNAIKVDYAFRDHSVLGSIQSYTVGIEF